MKGPGWGEGHEAERGFRSRAEMLKKVSGRMESTWGGAGGQDGLWGDEASLSHIKRKRHS